jgi:GDP-L-fucose synthase
MAMVVGYQGQLVFDSSQPDGAPRKLLDVSRLRNLGWVAAISLEDGLSDTYRWFLENQERFRC